MAAKLVYWFEEGGEEHRSILGGKGAGLAEMTRIGLPVPPGFTITTQACKVYYESGKQLPDSLKADIKAFIKGLEQKTGKNFGGSRNPLLVSVRSGAPISMPGMMDTILNLGLNEQSVKGLYEATQDLRFSYDCYRRFIQMFGNVVLGIAHSEFERVLSQLKRDEGVVQDQDVSAEGLQSLVGSYKQIIREKAGIEFPDDPYEQLLMAVSAVFESWNNERAIIYRSINKIPDDLGTAVNVQTMVFGNMGSDSGTGVMFTRDPSTGVRVLYGEYLMNAQGEDVVAGLRTPRPISEIDSDLPGMFEQLSQVAKLLEDHYKDMQDIEFTIERGKLYILQTRTGKRTAQATLEIARAMVHEGQITRETAVMRISPEEVARLLHRAIDPKATAEALAQGLPASPGAATGKVVFNTQTAESLGEKGEKIILVRPETTPDDMPGIVHAQGILTSRGGMTCHAAIVARGMGKPAVVGCDALRIDLEGNKAVIGGTELKEGDVISIDGGTGRVYLGEIPLVEPIMGESFREVLGWADEVRRLGVKANADTPEDARRAREFGAEGIGLCRTEHMFMGHDRMAAVQQMILADTEELRKKALATLLPMQEEDFYGILKAMRGYPVTIRLLDPPLHEFLPNIEELIRTLSDMRAKGAPQSEISHVEDLLKKARGLQEMNPMLGMRGCRLGIVYPEIYEMQARAIFQATARLVKEGISDVLPEVMIPLVGEAKELAILRERVVNVAAKVQEEQQVEFPVVVGTMIEIPRACLIADEIAEHAQFFSFGTNDLTQTTFGYSRDDAEAKFLHKYLGEKILKDNPFAVLDTKGVGKLVETAVKLGRDTRPGLVIGICGEHGGEPASIEFFHKAGLDYVSCSPYRVPVARLAAAQAALRNK
ncbi:MAG TPA: pyruvate, phosphate dikinase [Firmicutes bacterium]|nr:pyruvate, phosphate dikinase [Candidatus Fermentithermobacillaceae bacterium]